MKAFVVLSAVLACASAAPGLLLGAPGLLGSPLALTRTVSVAQAPIALAPVARTVSVVAAPVVAAPVSSQYHAQDELGQFSYGYAGGPSAKSEVKTVDGVTRGGYNYIDANGKLQSVSYVSDALGFRVAATNLPVAPSVPETPKLVGPSPVEDTPEVKAARAAHQKAVDEAQARSGEAPATKAAPEPAPQPDPAPAVELPQPPKDTPEVQSAREAHAKALAEAAAAAAVNPA